MKEKKEKVVETKFDFFDEGEGSLKDFTNVPERYRKITQYIPT